MRFGAKDSFISIERVGTGGSNLGWRIEACTSEDGWRSYAVCEHVHPDASPEARQSLSNFVEAKSHQLELQIGERGWLRMKRNGDCILVRYRISNLAVRSAVEGEVILAPESAHSFGKQLIALCQVPA